MPAAPVFLVATAHAEGGAQIVADVLEAAQAWAARVPAQGIAEVAGRMEDARFVLVAARGADEAPAELAQLAPARWARVDADVLLADPRGQLQRLCAFLGIAYDQALLSPVEHARRGVTVDQGLPALASVSTTSFGEALAQLGASLLISTYQTGKLVCARVREGELNTHFRNFDKPMGVAVAPGRIALGTRTEVWDLRDMPEAAPKVEPAGTHDACFLPRNRHVTGDIAVHDLGFAGGELWIVATAFSCLATLDAHHSLVPRWTPPFITRLAPEDRCHLNGMAIDDDRVTHVTALGRTDEPGGWRDGKATGGVLIDVASSEVAVGGLSMPHSPRWHDGRLWLLESGQGALCAVDLASGSVERVAELPGFTRGLAFAGDVAFVGLSQVRESSTFGSLPLVERLAERQCGVWMVHLGTGDVVGFLRFEDLVQEIFDVALLPGTRWPEIAEPDGPTTAQSYVLP
ncbi:MAG: repeat-containing protein [Solirubrobacterales bacterium]|nr:repeat-containing protein [Solirubrobacterales bacterium]